MTKALLYGFNPPFIGGPEKVMSRQEDDKLIRNDVLQLLLTVPGERVHRPNWGVNLRNFVFEQLDAGDIVTLRQEILDKIASYEQRITVISLDLYPDEENNGLTIQLVFSLVTDPRKRIDVVKFIAGVQNGE